ncbi:response regulator [Dyadobacter luticola]|uniref:response regulator n=1 Tax=Dyadobacter luticola TaxID=1979387 RepID=UPI00197AE9AD|nr:response regulator [Dyadobacter luticola]
MRRILLVDDDSDDSELFLEALHDLDASITCRSATDGVDALKKLDSPERPDIIFLDVNMPRMDGWECLDAIRNNPSFQEIPVVMYSTSSHEKEVKKAHSKGANHFFKKPDSFIALKETLRHVIGLG